jgi:hypothetical protein
MKSGIRVFLIIGLVMGIFTLVLQICLAFIGGVSNAVSKSGSPDQVNNLALLGFLGLIITIVLFIYGTKSSQTPKNYVPFLGYLLLIAGIVVVYCISNVFGVIRSLSNGSDSSSSVGFLGFAFVKGILYLVQIIFLPAVIMLGAFRRKIRKKISAYKLQVASSLPALYPEIEIIDTDPFKTHEDFFLNKWDFIIGKDKKTGQLTFIECFAHYPGNDIGHKTFKKWAKWITDRQNAFTGKYPQVKFRDDLPPHYVICSADKKDKFKLPAEYNNIRLFYITDINERK